jgi:tetratricopeptide (TPR) repeat protein
MTEALIANLAKIGSLRVISRTSVMQYKGARKPLPEIARELNVDGVIEGSVQRSGDHVRVTVQLIHAPTDRQLWTETYDKDLRDVLALQSEVAWAVTGQIKIKLTPQEQSQLAKSHQVNTEAYDNYLRGKFYFARFTKADSERAIGLLEQAVSLDPGFAEAHAALALAYHYQFVFFEPEVKQWPEKIFVEVEKALALDPDLADAYIVRGRVLWTHANHFQHKEAMREYRRALELNPNSDEALYQIGQIHAHIGLFDKAHQELQRAIAINPNNVRARWQMGQAFVYQGKYEEALATLRSLPRDHNPTMTGYLIAWALFGLGRKDEASATLEEFLRDFPEDTPGTLNSMQAVIFAAAGQRARAEEKIKVAAGKDRDSLQFHHTAYSIGAAYALMNKPEQAIQGLKLAAEDGFPCYPLFATDPNLNNIRQDPRFVEFIAKLGEQWERYKTTL